MFPMGMVMVMAAVTVFSMVVMMFMTAVVMFPMVVMMRFHFRQQGIRQIHYHADEVFMSWGMETPTAYAEEQVKEMLQALAQEETYGIVLRAKGMLPAVDGNWSLQIILHFPILAGNNQGQLINFEIIFLDSIIDKLGTYGIVLRAKGMLPAVDGNWIYFDYVPGEWEVRQGYIR